MKQETFKTKYGLILLAAGSAIGLGNVWRFPYIVGKNGGAIFVLIYFIFLVLIGIPMVNAELAIGRASKSSPKESFDVLGKTKRYSWLGWFSFIGPYFLMFFYTVITGWIINYIYQFITGSIFVPDDYAVHFGSMVSNPVQLSIFTVITIFLGFGILSIGFNRGVESITSKMMLLLLFAIILLVGNSLALPNAIEGLKFYLVPNFENVKSVGILRVIYEAMNQAFFTLSIGIGAIATFAAKSTDEKTTMNSALQIILLDTFVAVMAGLIIFPATTAFSIDQKAGVGLIFIVIPQVFKAMPFGNIWGAVFFLFLGFAAMSTVIATFEEIVHNYTEYFKASRTKAIVVNFFVVLLGSIPVILGFNHWSHVNPLGEGTIILDLYDFIVSANLLPLGALGIIIFIMSKNGWGYNNFIAEVNKGTGSKLTLDLRVYLKYILPLMIITLYAAGIIMTFVKI